MPMQWKTGRRGLRGWGWSVLAAVVLVVLAGCGGSQLPSALPLDSAEVSSGAASGSASGSASGAASGASAPAIQFTPERVADLLQQVLAGDRAAYARYVVDRTQLEYGNAPTLPSAAHPQLNVLTRADWDRRRGLPLPSQLLGLGYEFAAEMGEASYGLVSPWAINENHLPTAGFEQEAMEAILATGEPYRAYRDFRGRAYFSAMYPDRAIAPSCIACHNAHPQHQAQYPDTTFSPNSIMGGLVINLPLEPAATDWRENLAD